MKKLVNGYDCFGNEYGIFYKDGHCFLFDCFDYEHDGYPIADGSFDEMFKRMKEIIAEAEDSRF